MKRIRLLWLAALLALAVLAGCGSKANKSENAERSVYYIHQDMTKLKSVPFAADGDVDEHDTAAVALAMLKQMMKNPEDVNLSPAIPEGVEINNVSMADSHQFYVYFNSAYGDMDPVREILCRAAVVKTLTQLPEIDFVGFYVSDQPLMDSSSNAISLMSASSFVDVDSADYSKVVMTLYYADESGTNLLEAEKMVIFPKTKSREQLVIEQLIKGPELEGLYPTLSKDINLISATVRQGTCYLNFNAEFLNNSLNVSEYIPIYSIVNSLTELPNINKVQFSIEGNSNVTYKESFSFSQSYERKMDYVTR